MCVRGKIIFMGFGMGASVTPCLGGNKVFSGRPVFHNVMLFPCMAVPHAQKETAMPAVRINLQSPKDPHCQQCSM